MGLSRRDVLFLIASLPGGAAMASTSPFGEEPVPILDLRVPSKATMGQVYRLVVQSRNARRLQLFSNSDHHHTLIDETPNFISIQCAISINVQGVKQYT